MDRCDICEREAVDFYDDAQYCGRHAPLACEGSSFIPDLYVHQNEEFLVQMAVFLGQYQSLEPYAARLRKVAIAYRHLLRQNNG